MGGRTRKSDGKLPDLMFAPKPKRGGDAPSLRARQRVNRAARQERVAAILARTAASRAYLDAVIAGGRREEIPFKKVRPADVTVAPYSAAMLQTPSTPPATADPAFSIDISDEVWTKLEAFSSLVGKPVDDVAEYILKQSLGAPTDRAA